jgi:hypothetical protein
MVVKNNYFWLKDSDHAGFANGDIIEVLEIFNIKELYGFKFANVKIRMIDYQIKSLLKLFYYWTR